MNEIERKFLAKELPNLSDKTYIEYERYFLEIRPDFEDRIQRKNNEYERELKFKISDISRKTEKTKISKEEFEELKK